MSTTNSPTRTPDLPAGVRHYETSGFAESWEAYDALTPEDGWIEAGAYKTDTGERRSWKRRTVAHGGSVCVHQPKGNR